MVISLDSGGGGGCPLLFSSVISRPATSFKLASAKGSKVSRRRADRFRLAWGNFIVSSLPAVCRFLLGLNDWALEGSGENMLEKPLMVGEGAAMWMN